MVIGYLDLSGGASGDMLLAALLDAGYALADLEAVVAALGLASELRLEVRHVRRDGVRALQLDVVAERGPRRQRPALRAAIEGADLPADVPTRSLATLERLAAVEARIHGVPLEQLYLHELSGADTLVDIVGFHAGCAALGIERLVASPVNVGGGTVTFSHGTFAVPPPAVAELLRGIPSYRDPDVLVELVTPTGAALISTSVAEFGPEPPLDVRAVGRAIGSRTLQRPRVLRLLIGVVPAASA